MKRLWEKPEMTVLVRKSDELVILANGCKSTSYHSSSDIGATCGTAESHCKV